MKRQEQLVQILTKFNCQCLWQMKGPKHTQPNTLEAWSVPGKGVLICQLWKEGSVTVYADWPTGNTFPELEQFLSFQPTPPAQ